MNKKQDVPKWEQIKSKIRIGDYDLVGEMLDITRDAAKMRLRRNDGDALRALYDLIINREELIEAYQAPKSQ